MLMFNLFKAEPINYSVRTKTLSWRERDNILHKKTTIPSKVVTGEEIENLHS